MAVFKNRILLNAFVDSLLLERGSIIHLCGFCWASELGFFRQECLIRFDRLLKHRDTLSTVLLPASEIDSKRRRKEMQSRN